MDKNYTTRITPAKEDAVKVLKEEFSGFDSFIFSDFRGMTVAQLTALRTELRKSGAEYRVVKNRFAKIALRNLEQNGAEDNLIGPTGIALTKEDEANVVAKAMFQSITDGSPMVVKGALLSGKLMSDKEIEALSKLPTKLELIASLMGTMKAPVQKLAATLLAYVESKEQAAAPAAEAPVAEAAPAPAAN